MMNKSNNQTKLILIDLDGTLYLGDTFIDFLKLIQGNRTTYLLLLRYLLPLLATKIGFGDAGSIKEQIIAKLFKGKTKKQLHQYGQLFVEKYFEKNKNKKLLNQLSKLNGRKVIVSASLDWWVSEIAKKLSMEYISTRTSYENPEKIFTGLFSTPNCNNQEKHIRITKEINLSDYPTIFAFGNSKGDKYMFQLANHPYWITKSGQIKKYQAT